MPESNYSKELKDDVYQFLYKVLFDMRNVSLNDQPAIIDRLVQAYMETHRKAVIQAIIDKDVSILSKYGKFIKFSHNNPVCRYIAE
jgi:hypothetical protein